MKRFERNEVSKMKLGSCYVVLKNGKKIDGSVFEMVDRDLQPTGIKACMYEGISGNEISHFLQQEVK